jgi:hypothetical protein
MIQTCSRGHDHFTEFGCGVCKNKYVCRCCNKQVDFYGYDWCMIKGETFHRVCLFDRSEEEWYKLSYLFTSEVRVNKLTCLLS